MKPSFFSIARKPKWLGGLAIAALVAISFSLLMQWQLERTFSYVGVSEQELAAVPLDELAGLEGITPGAYDRLATVNVTLDPENSFIVQDRLQLVGDDLVPGYWLITNSFVEMGDQLVSLTVALGYSQDVTELRMVQSELDSSSHSITGYVEPNEAVKETESKDFLGSVSLAQLVNLYSPEQVVSFPVYLILSEGIDLPVERISIDIRAQEIEVNWLTAFYAIEWAFFALVAFYLWWRLVQDERARLST
jgi:surfeit locus 1 family protein